MFSNPETWVAIGFVVFVALAIYLKLPRMIAAKLDERADRIAKELDEAQRLREEAQALFAEYKRKADAAGEEAEAIIALAKEEAELYAQEAKAALDEMLERRTAAAEQKIEQAEAHAMQEVRAVAATTAVEAARKIIRENMDAKKANALIKTSIEDIKKHLH